MKTDRIFLAEWHCDSEDLDIPWPMVHEWAGHDLIRWINAQNVNDVQLLVEKQTGFSTGTVKLYVEFFQPNLRTEFALKFAK
jgi:hypothetical protein